MIRSALVMAALVGALAGQGLPTLSPTSQDASLARHGITMMLSTDDNFTATLAATLGSDLAPQIEPVAPFSVVVQNGSSMRVQTILVRYTMTDVNGKVSWGTSRLDFEPRNPLPSGATAVITPDAGISRILYVQRTTGKIPNGSTIAFFMGQLLDRYKRNNLKTIAPWLDGIAFENGGVIGPDTWDIIGESAARNEAISYVLAKVSDSSLSDDDLFAWLDDQIPQAEKAETYRGNGLFNHPAMQKVGMLHFASSSLKNAGRSITQLSLQRSSTSLFRLDQ